MAEEIVACPGCSKKFRIPEGAPPGSFACTACGVDVPYGKPAVAAKQSARPAAAAAARPAARAAAPAARAAAAPAARTPAPARGTASRRAAAEEDEAPVRGRRGAEPAPKKGNPALLWGGIAAGVVILGVVAYVMTKPAPKVEVPLPTLGKVPTPTPAPVAAPVKTEPPKPEPAPTPVATAPKPAPVDPAASTKPPEAGTTDPAATSPPPEVKKPAAPVGSLGKTVDSVPGTSDAERAEMEKLAALMIDRNAGREASDAEGTLKSKGKKAVPVLLSVFSKQYAGSKWTNEDDQWAAQMVQDLLKRIAPFDGSPEFFPRFQPGGLTPPEDFEKAANMWMSWWNSKGYRLEKFKRSND